MNTTINALRDITMKADNKPPIGHLPKYPAKNAQGAPTALPYISNIRDLKTKEDFSRNGRLNISMEASAERTTYQLTDHNTNKSFDMDTKGEGFSVLNSINYPRRAGFTKNLLMIHKDKNVFAGTRLGEKSTSDAEEEIMLLRKLQEAREKKESIMKLMTANEKKQKEKEAFQEKISKLRNDSARKIQLKWRTYRNYKACKKQLELNRAQMLKTIASKCESLLIQLNGRLILENTRLVNNIRVIQRNVRKFLAKKKLKILWRRKIANFIRQKLCQTLNKSQLKICFDSLKSCGAVKQDNSTFFVTTNPVIIGYTMATQDSSDFDNGSHSQLTQLRSSNSRCSSKERNAPSPNAGNHSNHLSCTCKRHNLHPKKSGECILSLNNTSITSLHNALEQKLESSQILKNKSSRFRTEEKSLSNINETTNPEAESTGKKISIKGARLPPSVPLKSNQSLSGPDDSKKGEKKAFKVWSVK